MSCFPMPMSNQIILNGIWGRLHSLSYLLRCSLSRCLLWMPPFPTFYHGYFGNLHSLMVCYLFPNMHVITFGISWSTVSCQHPPPPLSFLHAIHVWLHHILIQVYHVWCSNEILWKDHIAQWIEVLSIFHAVDCWLLSRLPSNLLRKSEFLVVACIPCRRGKLWRSKWCYTEQN
jgi:hypothetical protein